MYKNWDHVRDNRLYSYMNQAELATFHTAMQLQDISQQATALRMFALAQSEQIILASRSQLNQTTSHLPTVKYQFPSGTNTVVNDLTTLNLKLRKQNHV